MLERHNVASAEGRSALAGLSADLASLRIERSAEPAPSPRRGVARGLLVAGALAGVVAAAGVTAGPRLAQRLRRTPVAATVVSAAARADAREVLLTASGYVVADRAAQVGARVAGRLARVRVGEGDVVSEGDVLAEIDDAAARASLLAASAHAGAASARADAARASAAEIASQARRERSLALVGALARSSADDLDARLASLVASAHAADAEAKAASADLAPLRAALADHVIRAPQRGVVSARPMQPGEIASPGGAPVAVIYDPASVGLDVDVPEGRLALVRVGAEADVALDAYPGKAFHAAVERIGRRLDRAKATIPVRLRFVGDAALALPDMAARATFLGPEPERPEPGAAKRTVAAKAVAERGGAKVVFLIDGDRARAVPVAVGAARGAAVELEAGPPAGAKVVIDPPPSLEDGQSIEEEKNR